jgi:tight adherence protein C
MHTAHGVEILLLSDYQSGLLIASACGLGVAAAWLARCLAEIACRDIPAEIQSWQFDLARRATLRQHNEIYRWFEPLIEELAGWRCLKAAGHVEGIRRHLQTGAMPLPWTAEEFLSVKLMLGMILGTLVAVLLNLFDTSWRTAGIVFVLMAFGYSWFSSLQLKHQSHQYLRRFKRQLPFAVDQMALMMEAGASFRESLATMVREHKGHPVADQFQTVLLGLARGQTLQDALRQFDKRILDDDLHEMLGAVKRADELGQPLARLFLDLAEQMRLKRSQWAENAAGKAQANITFPGMLIMIACLIVAVAPFILAAMDQVH